MIAAGTTIVLTENCDYEGNVLLRVVRLKHDLSMKEALTKYHAGHHNSNVYYSIYYDGFAPWLVSCGYADIIEAIEVRIDGPKFQELKVGDE